MSATRGPKRRKLDQDGHENLNTLESSPASATSQRTPTMDEKRAGGAQFSPAGIDTSNNAIGRTATSSTDMWLKAKAQVRARGATKKLDVYDDIEGANRGRSRPLKPAKRLGSQSSLTKPLDPLRNQKAQEIFDLEKAEAGTCVGFFKRFREPRKEQLSATTLQENFGLEKAEAGTSVGFFKRFREPRKEQPGATTVQEMEPTNVSRTRNGEKSVVQPILAAEEEWDENGLQSEVPDSEDEQTNRTWTSKQMKSSAAPDRSTRVGKGYVYGKPKKTFEDEIRELEENARKNAHDNESEDKLASEITPARGSLRRKRTPRTTTTTVQKTKEMKSASSPIAKATRPPGRQKFKPPIDERKNPHDPAIDDMMEIENLEREISTGPEKYTAVNRVEPVVKLSTPREPLGVTPKKASTKATSTFDPESLGSIQRMLLERVTGKRAVPLQNLNEEYAKVYSVIDQTITAGESNSMLLIGARGSGKTALINQILREQATKHANDFHAVRLNGFIHTDDKVALREIWRQLGREMELDENEATSKNYADTMSKLLALLSHSSEIGIDAPDQLTKSIVFVLDEFELFAGHPRQTLLYNLFDIAQSRKAPIVVLGLTTRIDVADSLEKRVKSRFSHRYVHLGLSKSFEAFKQICKSALSVTASELSQKEGHQGEASTGETSDGPSALSQWNALVDQVLATEHCNAYLRKLYCTTKSLPDFFSTMSLALATMPISSSTSSLLLKHFSEAFNPPALQPPDSKLSILATISTLQLALLICAARLSNIYNTEIISLALVFEEYKVLASKARLQASASGMMAQGAGSKVWSKEVATGAWEELVDCGLILEDGSAGGTGRVDVGLEEIGMSGVDLGPWGRWCKEI